VILSLVQQIDSAETARTLKNWLARRGLPATLLLSAPLDDREDIVVAVQVPELNAKAAALAQNGFRRGKVPPRILVARAASEPVDRLDVDRADLDFIFPRGGAMNDLISKTVTVIGCGSVGSFTAAALASSGIGHLVLVDHQKLKTENFQRHLLGASSLGDAKVAGVTRALKARFPHLKVTEISTNVQESLDKPDSPALRADLILCAVGEDNLELQLNELLFGRHRCMHVWLDPLGIGGHVLRTGTRGNHGCFQCLFRSDPILGLINMASLVAPNQKFQRTLAGCSGTFTPFGALDAERAGIEAAREVIAALSTDQPTAQLTSWVVSKSAVVSGDFALSHRSQTIAEDTLVRDASFVRADCPICSRGSA
jgi:molybdopterin/thiamine biosynthesis adenylyltransferase